MSFDDTQMFQVTTLFILSVKEDILLENEWLRTFRLLITLANAFLYCLMIYKKKKNFKIKYIFEHLKFSFFLLQN